MKSRAVLQSSMDRCDDIKARAVVAGATFGMTAEAVAQRPDDTTIIDFVAKGPTSRRAETTTPPS